MRRIFKTCRTTNKKPWKRKNGQTSTLSEPGPHGQTISSCDPGPHGKILYLSQGLIHKTTKM
jgi:hypothetical protein